VTAWHGTRQGDGQAGGGPSGDPTRERAHVGVSHLLQAQRGQCRATAGTAVDHHRLRFMRRRGAAGIGHGRVPIDLELEHAPRDVDGAGEMAGFEFERFPDIDQYTGARLGAECLRSGFPDPGAGLGDKVGGSHGHGGFLVRVWIISVDSNIREP
jgi:hypothetical protein